MLRCFPALTASDPSGTSSRIVVPLPTYAPFPTVTTGAQRSKRSDGRAGLDARSRDHGVVENRDAIADLRIDDARAAVDFAAAADRRPALQKHGGVQDGVRPDRHVVVDIRGV